MKILNKTKNLTKTYSQLQQQIQFIMEDFQNNFLSIRQKLIEFHNQFYLKIRINLIYLNRLRKKKKDMLFV